MIKQDRMGLVFLPGKCTIPIYRKYCCARSEQVIENPYKTVFCP